MVARAKELNMDALAITDHGNLFGVLEFYSAARNAGIKPIIGMEAYMAPRSRSLRKPIEGESNSYHLVLLAKNQQGFKNLIKLSSYAFLEGMYYKPRIDKELLRKYSEGLIATSACMKGEIAYKLRRGMKEKAVQAAEEYLEIFGDDFYFEIQDHHIPEEAAVYPQIYDLAEDMGVPVIATNDNHYLRKGDHEAHDILLCLQTGKDRDDPNRLRYGTEDLYLKSADEMYALFKDKPKVLERTSEIAEKTDLNIDFSQRHLPKFPIPKEEGDISADEYLRRLTFRGAKRRYPNMDKSTAERIEYELSVIQKMGFAGYFLIVQDFINAARQSDIPVGLGRGSAAGSIVAYNLGITNVDPLRYGLLFERFLNPARVTMPDIDVDFCYERRDEVIEYVKEKYGKNNVAQIITFGTMASRGVIRDVARVLKLPVSTADSIAKKVPMKGGVKPVNLKSALQNVDELKQLAESDDVKMRELFKYSQTLEGIARHTSVHAAGIIITPDNIINYVPLYKNSDKEITTQWTMDWSEAIGLLKMDFLGLRNLTVIKKTENLIRERRDPNFSVENLSFDDEATYHLFGEGLTVGVFQFESSGMQEYLRKLKPSRIEDLIAMNALYRPGPMNMIDDFIDRKYGRKKIDYPHPALEPILKETYGIIVYQEQVMRIASELAGFRLADADLMRKAMSKKKKEEMVAHNEAFIEGCIKNGIKRQTAFKIAELIDKFAEYGFNKSHSAAYAIIAYQTAYLKAHFPAEFMAANLTSEVKDSDRVMILMDECKKLGIKIKAPDVNYSHAHFLPIADDEIAFGMAAIKNVGTGAIHSIVEARENEGRFGTIYEMLQNVDLRLVNKKVLESLIQAGALDSLEGSRAQKFNAIEQALEFAQNIQGSKNKNINQRNLFDLQVEETPDQELLSYPPLPQVPDWPVTDKLKKEKELLGFYFSGHPLDSYRSIIELYTTDLTPYILKVKDGETEGLNIPKKIAIGGKINEMRVIHDKKNQKMAFVKIEDFDRTYEAVIFGSVFPQFEPYLQTDAMVYIKGKLNSALDESIIKVIGEQIMPLDEAPEALTESILLSIKRQTFSSEDLHHLKLTLKSSPGKSKVYVQLNMNGEGAFHFRSTGIELALTRRTLQELSNMLGLENIKVKVKA